MNRKHSFLLSLPLLLLTSCASGLLSPEEIHETAQVIAATGIPLTLTALPSNTELPTAMLQPSSTSTLPPSPSPSEAATESPTAATTFLATWTPYGQSEPGALETAKADKADSNAPLLLENRSGEEILFIIVSPRYQEYSFSGSMTLILPEAQYSYRAWIGNDGPFNGSFSITNGDKHVLTFNADKIHFSTP